MMRRPAESMFWILFAVMLAITMLGSFVLSSATAFRIFSFCLILPCALVIPLLRDLEQEYDHGSSMWWAWRLMSVSSAAEALRHGIDFASSLQTGPLAYELRGLSLIPTLLAIMMELASLVLIWGSFNSIGIHKPFARKDWFSVFILSLLVLFCFVERSHLPHATSSMHLFRQIELANPVLFAIGIVVATLLYRLSNDLGGGDFALSIAFLALQLAARFLGFALETLRYRFNAPMLSHPSNACYWSSAWFIFWAILLRRRMTQKAQEAIREYEVLRTQRIA